MPVSHPIHASLVRTPLLAGAEPGFVVFEVCTILALLFAVGLHVATVALSIFYGTVVHSFFVWIAAQDPQTSALYLRSLAAADYYPASPRLAARPRAVRAAIPSA